MSAGIGGGLAASSLKIAIISVILPIHLYYNDTDCELIYHQQDQKVYREAIVSLKTENCVEL